MSNGLKPAYNDEEQKRAAYALNMCMVSISQIIDYNDLNVLEQEYDGILNNLNLEMMPKDEALLSILKQILDTITFFRINEGDRKIIDKEYQNKMKNAIWSAVPNLGLLVAGGNLVTMAISLASQVGVGYMNYRKAKIENQLEYEKQMWKLQRSAIEQFNGLRRELFDTAWRLAGAYNFPDSYRLTERQIEQYNSILMDTNTLRRYDRLDAVKDSFVAYPPFWYQFGNTANEISRDDTLEISEDTRVLYRERAKSYFEEYWRANTTPLLREDQMSAACALEYVDFLIEDKADTESIIGYLEKAVAFSGRSCDVLQMVSMAYLRIGYPDMAAPLLRYLVNEEYNVSINAQILSGIYVNQGIDGVREARSDYEILLNRVSNPRYLIPWPDNKESLGDEFVESQRLLLSEKYKQVMEAMKDKYVIMFNKLLPPPIPSKEYPDSFYTEAQKEDRIEKYKAVFGVAERKDAFLSVLSHNDFSFAYIDLLNQLFVALESIDAITNLAGVAERMTEKISQIADDLNSIQSKMQRMSFSIEDFITVQRYTSESFISTVFDMIIAQIHKYVMGIQDMSEFSREESNLISFCSANQIPDPDVLISGNKGRNDLFNLTGIYFNYNLLGQDAKEKSQKREKYNRMKGIINTKIRECILPSSSVKLIMVDEEEQFSKYFSKTYTVVRTYKPDTIAVLDDTGLLNNFDLLFTTAGVACVVKEQLKDVKTYENIKFNREDDCLEIGSRIYKNKNINIEKLYSTIAELNRVVVGEDE